MIDEAANRAAFEVQAAYCDAMAAPITASVCRALGRALTRDTATGRAVLDWAGDPVADAVVLRLVGGLHALHRAGIDADLSRIFTGDTSDFAGMLAKIVARHDAALLAWLSGPPQTNEVGRSAGLMTGLLHLAHRSGSRVELLEIGSSAGLNLLMDRFAFDLGGVTVGPADGLPIKPEWRGPPPPAGSIEIVRKRGVDIAPIDLAEPQPAGVARVLVHSVVWQYLSEAGRDRIRDAMMGAGERAMPERPLGWVMMEPNRDLHRQEVRVRGWPGDTPMALVALTHAHGAWVEGLALPYPTRDYIMRRGG